MTRKIVALCAALALCAPAAVLAFDCSSARPLPCDGTPVSGTIGLPPEVTFTQCGGTTSFKHQLYTLTLASPAIVTVALSSNMVGIVDLVVFDGCDESLCLAQSPANTAQVTTDCLSAGTYTVALYYLVEAVIPYDITATCESCDPVAADRDAWGSVKSLYR